LIGLDIERGKIMENKKFFERIVEALKLLGCEVSSWPETCSFRIIQKDESTGHETMGLTHGETGGFQAEGRFYEHTIKVQIGPPSDFYFCANAISREEAHTSWRRREENPLSALVDDKVRKQFGLPISIQTIEASDPDEIARRLFHAVRCYEQWEKLVEEGLKKFDEFVSTLK
jgi:hypothetical protein